MRPQEEAVDTLQHSAVGSTPLKNCSRTEQHLDSCGDRYNSFQHLPSRPPERLMAPTYWAVHPVARDIIGPLAMPLAERHYSFATPLRASAVSADIHSFITMNSRRLRHECYQPTPLGVSQGKILILGSHERLIKATQIQESFSAH